jgi:hypothetical protein
MFTFFEKSRHFFPDNFKKQVSSFEEVATHVSMFLFCSIVAIFFSKQELASHPKHTNNRKNEALKNGHCFDINHPK